MAVILVTGCSTGFGLLTALELARRGDHVFATMRDPERGDALRAALDDAGGQWRADGSDRLGLRRH